MYFYLYEKKEGKKSEKEHTFLRKYGLIWATFGSNTVFILFNKSSDNVSVSIHVLCNANKNLIIEEKGEVSANYSFASLIYLPINNCCVGLSTSS